MAVPLTPAHLPTPTSVTSPFGSSQQTGCWHTCHGMISPPTDSHSLRPVTTSSLDANSQQTPSSQLPSVCVLKS
ncbi:MAG: hypothetical protein R3F39_21860 [Myxococcota bacterium]